MNQAPPKAAPPAQKPEWATPPAPVALATQADAAAIKPFDPKGLWPRTFEEVERMALKLSKTGLVPKHLQGNEFNTFYTIMAGLELNISPLVACREIYLVDGKPNCSSLLKVALVRESPQCMEFVELESTAKKCTFQARRKGDPKPTIRSWTIEEAAAAGLLSKDNWKKYPAAMLRRRVQGWLCDDLFPDVVRGLGSMDDDIPVSGDLERVTPMPSGNPFRPETATEERPKEEVEDAEVAEATAQSNEPSAVDQMAARIREVGQAGTEDTLDLLTVEIQQRRKEFSEMELGILREEVRKARIEIQRRAGGAA